MRGSCGGGAGGTHVYKPAVVYQASLISTGLAMVAYLGERRLPPCAVRETYSRSQQEIIPLDVQWSPGKPSKCTSENMQWLRILWLRM